MFSKKRVAGVVAELLDEAVVRPPRDVVKALEKALKAEKNEAARMQFKAILENIRLAGEKKVPVCQDTGIAVVYVKVGGEAKADANELRKGVVEGVRKATKEIPLRPNVVDPLTRENTGDNTGEHMPYINFSFLPEGDYVEVTVMPKGAGSENMSALAMLKPSEGVKGVKRFVLEVAAKAAGNPCPPTIVGVGIGGSSDLVMALAKKAALRPLDEKNKDEVLSRLEDELEEAINQLGVGPMGLGGTTTCLGVKVEKAGCHTASLPVGVNLQCWTGRRATARIYEDKIEWLS